MPQFAKRLLIVLAAIVVVGALILLSVNLYLQSSDVQQRIRKSASQSLGVEIAIRSTSYTPWNGLVLRGLSIADPTSPDRNMVDAEALRIRFAYMPLFQGRFIVRECTLFEPKLTARQLENGDWMVPLPAKVPPTPAEAPATPKPAKPSGTVMRASLEKFRLVTGDVTFIDRKGRTALVLSDVDIEADLADDMTAEGQFAVDQVEIGELAKPRKVKGPFTWDGTTLTLPQIDGSLAGGRITGDYRVLALGPKPSYDMSVTLQAVELKKLATEANFKATKTEGLLNGTLKLSGDPRDSDKTVGAGMFELVTARFQPVDFMVKLGELLNIEELRLLKLKDAKVIVTIKDEKIFIDQMVLQSDNLILTSSGPIRFNGKMNLDAKLKVNEKLQRQLKGILGRNFVPSEEEGYQEVAFTVTGKPDSPRTDLLEKIIGIDLGQDIGGLLKGFFRPPPPSNSDR